MSIDPNEKKGWLDQPANVDKLIKGLYALCALTVLAEFVVHMHPHFEAEKMPAFYGVFGFVAFVAIVRGGQLLRKLIMRDKGYYDE
jgi:hypothetical protein